MKTILRSGEWKLKCPSSKLDQIVDDVFEDKKFHLEKVNETIQLKKIT